MKPYDRYDLTNVKLRVARKGQASEMDRARIKPTEYPSTPGLKRYERDRTQRTIRPNSHPTTAQ